MRIVVYRRRPQNEACLNVQCIVHVSKSVIATLRGNGGEWKQ